MEMIVTPAQPVALATPLAEVKFIVSPRYTGKRTLTAASMVRGFSERLPNGNILFRDPRTETYVEATVTPTGVTLVADHGHVLDAARAAVLPVTPRKAARAARKAASAAPVAVPAPTPAPSTSAPGATGANAV